MSNTSHQLIIDIETIGEPFDSIDEATQADLTRWIKKESDTEEAYKVALEELKQGLGFSPLTGKIVAIGVLDVRKNQGAVYFEAPEKAEKEFSEENFVYKPMPERQMLEAFWKGVANYNHFITFNGRSFDVPFLMLRSAIHQIRPSKDLMRGRYLYQHNPDAVHIDLLDQLSFYGAVRRKGTLHLYTRAFGIESPKTEGVTGDEVGALFAEGRYKDIARYNARDLVATKLLYERWHDYLRF